MTRRRYPVLPGLASLLLAALLIALVAGAAIAPHDPNRQDLIIGAAAPQHGHFLGTDELGRDVFSRLIAGTRAALLAPLLVVLCTLVIGPVLGMIAGYRGGFFDTAISRLADLIWSLPALLVAIVVIGTLSGGTGLAVAVIAFLSLPHQIRLSRSATLVQARMPYIDAARTLGLSRGRIIFRHLLPNIAPTLLATALLDFVAAMVGFAALAYLGVGVQPGSANWGTILADGQQLIAVNPWMLLGPAIAISASAASVTVLGDWTFDRISERR